VENSLRRKHLKNILAFTHECEPQIIQALKEDLGKPIFESSVVELGSLRSEITYALKNLDRWTRPQTVCTPLIHQIGKSWIQYQPLGKILIIAPWNYPFQLTLGPLVSAIAAGNSACIKPSELAPASSHLLASKLPTYLDADIQEGGPEVTQALLDKQWDHIFFTGSSRVGRIVLEKAAKFLTPVTLELGGKCPAIVDSDADLKIAARRIAWGKFINAGQTCVAPDTIFAHEKIKAELMLELQKAIAQFFGNDPKQCPDYAQIINHVHLERLIKISPQSDYDLEKRYFAPTLLEHPIEDEIFGPILPVLSFKKLDEVIKLVNAQPKPLALYYFSSDKAAQQQIISSTHSGAVCINDTISHLGIPGLPFGGVGESGFGAYHGRWGFERFSQTKPVYSRSTWLDLPLRYPPYSNWALKIAKWFQ
jgi:aldehyde dehydrogenase (NAD+)